ncbi:MAG TPA: carbon monoxide dehydrogenase [Actinobacteria bacterium]|nr:carbon monoxide dehydrogenase [Actinomycetota bacterium]
MSKKIAIAGKGGVGKTTTSGLIIRALIDAGKGTVLALDADPNSNLNEVLGVEISSTIGKIREDLKKDAPRMTGGIFKDTMVEMNIHQALAEGNSFDLLVMGRGEGPGCYCAANNLFKIYIDRLQGNYGWVVMDNEAGMEHLSRRTTNDVDYLFIISDPSPRGILTAARIRDLAKEIDISAGQVHLIVGRANGKLDERLEDNIKEKGLDLLGVINTDDRIYDMDLEGSSVFDLPEDASSLEKVREMLDKAGIL